MYICIQFTINFLFVGLYTLYDSGSFRAFERVFSYSIQRCEFPFLCLVTRNKLALNCFAFAAADIILKIIRFVTVRIDIVQHSCSPNINHSAVDNLQNCQNNSVDINIDKIYRSVTLSRIQDLNQFSVGATTVIGDDCLTRIGSMIF